MRFSFRHQLSRQNDVPIVFPIAIITQAIVHHYGRDEFPQRLSHPFWFQSFGAVMGMDWHSSGITTSVIGALKRGLGRYRTNSAFTCAAPLAEDTG
jgi:hypothetical protein